MHNFDPSIFVGSLFAVFAVAYLLLGILTGIIGVINAWFGDLEIAKWLGWICAAPGGIVGILLGAAYAAFVPYASSFPWAFVIPAVLGALTLAHVYAVRTRAQLSRYQFSMPAILYATLVAAILVMAGNFIFGDHTDYSKRNEFAANLARMRSIDEVTVLGHKIYRFDKEEFEVHEIQFSLAGRPDTLVRIFADKELRACDSDDALSTVVLHQVGRLQFHATVKSSELNYPFDVMGINVGPEGAFEKHFPFPLRSIDDIVDNYDQIVEILKTWPRENEPGELILRDCEVKYWAIEASPTGR